jgi:hypothetical protein
MYVYATELGNKYTNVTTLLGGIFTYFRYSVNIVGNRANKLR